MRTDEERIKEMHERAGRIEHERRAQRSKLLGGGFAALSLALIAILASFMPGLFGSFVPVKEPGSMNASIFAGSSAVGYIVIGFLAFILGCAVTIFCYRLKKWQKDASYEDGDAGMEELP